MQMFPKSLIHPGASFRQDSVGHCTTGSERYTYKSTKHETLAAGFGPFIGSREKNENAPLHQSPAGYD